MMSLRILAIHPGASISTSDIYDGMVPALRAQGHEVYEYLLDKRIDRAGGWLKYNWRHSDPGTPKPNPYEILYWAGFPSIEMALRLQPDFVLIFSGMYYLKYLIQLMHNTHLPIALLASEDPYDTPAMRQVLPYVDIVFTNERTVCPSLMAECENVVYLPHAYDPSRHYPGAHEEDALSPSHDVVFVGTLFEERLDLLNAVDWTGIDLGLYGSFSLMGSRSKLRRYVHGQYVDNPTAAALYRRAKIGLNLHRTSMGFGRHTPKVTTAESLNPRAYELGACGLFHLSDDRAEVREVYGGLVPTFRDPQELEILMRSYLADEDARARIAAQLPAAVAGHTFQTRACLVISMLERVLAERGVTPTPAAVPALA